MHDDADALQRTARRAARAFGPGQPWAAACAFHAESERTDDARQGLAVMRRGATVERAGEAITPRALGALGPADRLTVEAWQESHCLRAGTSTRPDRVREVVAWVARGPAATPLARMDADFLGALSYARLPPHLAAWLDVYALQRWERWPLVQRCAVHIGLHPQGTADAAARILWRRAAVSQDCRARQLHMQAAAYRTVTRRAEGVLRAWLYAAHERIAAALGQTESHPGEG